MRKLYFPTLAFPKSLYLGKNNTSQFGVKGWWISVFITLFGIEKFKSNPQINCIKEAIFYIISKINLELLCKKIPTLSQLYITNLEYTITRFQKQILENLTLTAKDYYLSFINFYLTIEQNVKNYHITSFLEIENESLIRIRKNIANP